MSGRVEKNSRLRSFTRNGKSPLVFQYRPITMDRRPRYWAEAPYRTDRGERAAVLYLCGQTSITYATLSMRIDAIRLENIGSLGE